MQLEQGAVADHVDVRHIDVRHEQAALAADTSRNAGSGSSIEWWTKNSHFGASTADLQQQVKQAVAATGSSSEAIPAVLPAPPAGIQYLASGDAGQDVFLLGLRSYLQDLSYQNSNYSTLWQHLEAASGQPVSRMMNTWTLRR